MQKSSKESESNSILADENNEISKIKEIKQEQYNNMNYKDETLGKGCDGFDAENECGRVVSNITPLNDNPKNSKRLKNIPTRKVRSLADKKKKEKLFVSNIESSQLNEKVIFNCFIVYFAIEKRS